ncbi:DUF2235 domain-containing protein [Amycolatopsis sp. NPDC049688]|uniref:DUF2235 domain-containing protein n=1 Tax=Amycolatopsis sp. NPDC049688 TaxID=3154733 RepID=UPI0034292F0E
MAKRLVICCDGTWNKLGQPNPTNVAKVKKALAETDSAGMWQIPYHSDGVGTGKDLWDHLTGGAFGLGLSAKVQEAYKFVVTQYEPGDELFFFGFSRGAYTARSTVGFIRNCGVLRPENLDRLEEAYQLYRDRDQATGPGSPRAREFRARYAHEDVTPIRFVGVWDTVGALGIPLSGGRLIHRLNKRWQFHDTDLSSIVQSAFQALAVDEHRKSFSAAVWKASGDPGQVCEQVWFAGDHSDVGGGHPVSDLSDLALRWMTDRAEQCGLAFRPDALAALGSGNALGELHDSFTGFFRWFGSADRGIGVADQHSEFAASTAVDRHQHLPYAPGNLVGYLAQPGHQVQRVPGGLAVLPEVGTPEPLRTGRFQPIETPEPRATGRLRPGVTDLLVRAGRMRRQRRHGGDGRFANADPPRRLAAGDVGRAVPQFKPDVGRDAVYPPGAEGLLTEELERAALWTAALCRAVKTQTRVSGKVRSAIGLVTDGTEIRLGVVFYVRRLALLQAAPLSIRVEGQEFPVVLRPPPVLSDAAGPVVAGEKGMITCRVRIPGGRGLLTAAHVAGGRVNRYRLQAGDKVDFCAADQDPATASRRKVLASCGVMDAAIVEDTATEPVQVVPITGVVGFFPVRLTTPEGGTVVADVIEAQISEGVIRGSFGMTPNVPAEVLITASGRGGWSGSLVTETLTAHPYGMFLGDATLRSGPRGRVHLLRQHEIVWDMQICED